jgi:hypothetical protein
MEEVIFRFQRLTVIYNVRWDVATLINWLGQSVSVTGAELQEALERSTAKRRKEGDA